LEWLKEDKVFSAKESHAIGGGNGADGLPRYAAWRMRAAPPILQPIIWRRAAVEPFPVVGKTSSSHRNVRRKR
jgi:hypothetical protein